MKEVPAWIDRRYEVLARVGQGMGGEVFQVRGPQGLVALKLLNEKVEGQSEEERLATFKFEFSLLKGLEHPNIVRIHDFGHDEALRRPYFTQEWLEGRPLDGHDAPWSYAQVREILIQALQGLAYLHAHGVLHGDLKPENLFLLPSSAGPPRLKVIDFGISRPDLAKAGGTPPYLAPEKILKEDVDGRSDLYALAVTCYSLLAGKNPFLRQNIFATLRAQLHFFPPSIAVLRPEVEPAFSALLDLMLQKNPRSRPASAEDALKYLETNGEIALAPARPRSLPKSFVGRAEILAEAKAWLAEVKAGAAERALIVSGDKGLGGEALLTELKYEAELQGLDVLTSPEEEIEKGLAILSAEEFIERGETPACHALVTALPPAEAGLAAERLRDWQPRLLELRPLDRSETEKYLREVTRNAELPAPFLEGLYAFSGGSPDALRGALESLLQDPLIVDASGKWHLAAYRESGPNFLRFARPETDWAQLLAQEKSPARRWQVELLQAEALAKADRLDAAREVLLRLEAELPRLFSRTERLEKKPRLLELRGWIYAKLGRYAEAREDFAAALSLLKESEAPSVSLELRLKNFNAFLDLQEGRIEEAIREFEATRDRARELPALRARLVTNNELANAYLAAGRLQEGIAQLKADLDFFAHHPDPFFKMKVAYNLGEALTQDRDYAAAAVAYRRVAETARLERHWEYLIRAYNGLGNVASLMENRESSLDYYQRSLALAEYRRDYLSAATVAQNRGVILSELGRMDEAAHDLEVSKRLVAKVHPSSHTRYLMARATLELGEVHRKQRDYAAARSYFLEARNRSEEDVHLKNFRFYPLASLAALALDEGDLEEFRRLAPDLIHLCEGEAEKKTLDELLARAPIDPRAGREEKPAPRLSSADAEAGEIALANILKINRALLTEREPRLLFRKILEHAAELCGAETALLLLEDATEGLKVQEAFNTELDQGQIEISQQIARQVLESGNSAVTPDAQHDRGFNQFQSVVALHLRSIACVPIRAGLRSVGVLYLTHRFQTDLFNPRTLRLLEAFGDQAGLALQNVQNLQRLEEMNSKLQGQLVAAEEEIGRLKVDLRSQLKNPYPRILGKSRAIVEILGLLDRVSDTNLSILILGETGSGKELVARSVHEHSRRRQGPFVAVNCGAIPENLMESELFGYKAGAFTGANRDKKGLLEEAQGGTLFLDEIAELPLNTQAKLLRALQEKEIVRLGETRPTSVDLRVVAATHRRLEEWIAEGKFREDLYYRVAQMVLQLPALRERREDLLLLADHFLERSAQEHRLSKTPRLSREVLTLMNAYDWPGNIRELENFIRTSAAFAERGLIKLEAIPAFLRTRLSHPPEAPLKASGLPVKSEAAGPRLADISNWSWERYEEALYGTVLARHQANCEKTARELGVGVATVYVKIRKYNLKSRLEQWRKFPGFPENTTVEGLRRKVILETHRRLNSSAYAVAERLGLNVGTIYRQLRESPQKSLSN